MMVSKNAILLLINGKWRSGLYNAFVWDETPQGGDFWVTEAENGPTLEGAKALLKIVERAKREGRLV